MTSPSQSLGPARDAEVREVSTPKPGVAGPDNTRLTVSRDLFLLSALLLFLELACIRWFPAHVLFLTFFTNIVLLGCFLGMSVGCLAAGLRRRYLPWTPVFLVLALAAPHGLYFLQERSQLTVDVNGADNSPEHIFFGTDYARMDLTRFSVPMEIVAGVFFLLLALVFLGLGQELGRMLNCLPNRLQAYTVNIAGSLAGIGTFAVCSWFELTPLWWFVPIALTLGYFLLGDPGKPLRPLRCAWTGLLLFALLWLSDLTSRDYMMPRTALPQYVFPAIHNRHPAAGADPKQDGRQLRCYWSPYYRIDYEPAPSRAIFANLIIHQNMQGRARADGAYALPHLLWRDSGGRPFGDVLVIGAGSGNDVSQALRWGATHVDAVEIDPVIAHLGKAEHPDRPYDDQRVAQHITDGRNFLRRTDRQYELVIYALVDSLVLHSSQSNVRLESYLFTRQAMADVRRKLKPRGLFVIYNYFRHTWLITRLQQLLRETFEEEPLVLTIPFRPALHDGNGRECLTILLAGETAGLSREFQRHVTYALQNDRTPGPDSPDGFAHRPGPGDKDRWQLFGLTNVVAPEEPLRTPTDDWPFLYLRRPMLPELNLRGLALMGAIAAVLLVLFWPQRRNPARKPSGVFSMFLLGAGFMLVETKAVVQMALVFGSTWLVNSLVVSGVLAMILCANLWIWHARPRRLWLVYMGLIVSLSVSGFVPLDLLVGLDRSAQVALGVTLVFTPLLFAGVIFALRFEQSPEPNLAFGANIAGAMAGGLMESFSMLIGFQLLSVLAAVLYAAGAWPRVCVSCRHRLPREVEKPC